MSSSCGEPSKKMGWYKSMLSKIKHENRLWDSAMKVAEGGKPNVALPTVKCELHKPANVKLFENLIIDAKVERSRRKEKEDRKAKQKKEESKA